MSVQRVKDYLKKWNLSDRVLEMDTSTATVEQAAQALGVQEGRIAKTLALRTEEGCMLLVTAGDTKIDNKKFKQLFSRRPRMLGHEEAQELTGFAVGGVCPFSAPQGVSVYADESLKRFETIFPACGSGNSAIEITCGQLEEIAPVTKWVDVTKPM
ncbi:MAG: YbaK/EbsC family protein [Christensenellales bacterium]|jgi:prolyl-tRNA editing enzyme YbaK/EbsC (Cys-tRNA(Pro) deacylase)